jgi:hypothetical protein
MGEVSEDDDVSLAQIAKRAKTSAPNLLLTEDEEVKENTDESNGDAGVHDEDTVSSDEGETDMAKKKARIELFWKTKRAKEAEVDAQWAATVFEPVVVREQEHTHDRTISYSLNPNSVVELYPYKREITGSKCFLGNVSVHRKYLKMGKRLLLIPGQICLLFGNEKEFFCLSTIILTSKAPQR